MKIVKCLICIILIIVGLLFISNNNELIVSSYRISNAKDRTIAMLFEIDSGSGIYEEQVTNNWPASGYKFNKELSKCKFGSDIIWDSINNKVIVNSDNKEYCYVYFDVCDNICKLARLHSLTEPTTINLTDGYIYYHDGSLENGASDNSYRYAGSNPNNYVCFGSNAANCPDDNLYRIIGIFYVDTVIDETTTPVTTRKKALYTIIKNDYETESSLGMTKVNDATKVITYNGPANNMPSGIIDGFYWSGSNSNRANDWNTSTLNNNGLNTNILNSMSTWAEKIATVKWYIGGDTWSNMGLVTPVSIAYHNEINVSQQYLFNKIGLLYVSDYAYSTIQSSWNTRVWSYNNGTISTNNWLYRGVNEWTITRLNEDNGDYDSYVYDIYIPPNNTASGGAVDGRSVYDYACALRRVFYLKENALIDMTNHDGTISDPFRIS